jgi:hypothetical protein
MNETVQKNNDFLNVYTKSYRLAAAVFLISNVIDHNDELKTIVKNLSLSLVSVAVDLKDVNSLDTNKSITNLEKISLELMSMLDIASVSNLISKMNGSILKEEFQAFILELGKFSEKFETDKNISVKGLFGGSSVSGIEKINGMNRDAANNVYRDEQKNYAGNGAKNGNGYKRKDLRKNTILDFIKGHNLVSIKDIAANITGCSEKTVQRELISLIEERKIKKIGERRWSRYSIAE